MDLYRVLGVGRSATQSQIKVAFRALALELHPDRLATSSDGHRDIKSKGERFRKVTAAYEILSNANKRKDYDQQYGYGGYGGTWASSQRYTSQGPVSRHTQTNGMKTEYRPGGRMHTRGRSTDYEDQVQSHHFNMAEWEAAHYGDSAAEQGTAVGERHRAAAAAAAASGGGEAQNGKSGRAWMNMGPKSHQSYFRKKAARAAAAAAEKMNGGSGSDGYTERPGASGPAQAYAAYAAAAEESVRNSRNSASENLNGQRTERRKREEAANSKRPKGTYATQVSQNDKKMTGAQVGVNDQCIVS